MKKIVLSFVVLATTVLASQAQTRFGLKLGMNLMTLGGDDVEDADLKSKIGFHAGGIVNIPVSDNFAIQPELLYSGEGAKMEDGDDRANYNLSYINVPIMLQYVNSGFHAEFGPQVGLLVAAKLDTKIGGVNNDIDIKDQLKGANFSLALGAGYRLTNGFGFGARYTLGLGNIADAPDAEIKTRGFQIGISYLFGGGNSGNASKK